MSDPTSAVFPRVVLLLRAAPDGPGHPALLESLWSMPLAAGGLLAAGILLAIGLTASIVRVVRLQTAELRAVHAQNYRGRTLQRFRMLAVVIAVAGLATVSVGAYWMLSLARQSADFHRLVTQTEMHRVHLAEAHIWLEEALEGDLTVDVESDVLAPLAAVQRFCGAPEQAGWRRGGAIHSGLNRTEVDFASLCRRLERLRTITDLRLSDGAANGPGSRADEEYDAVYRQVVTILGGIHADLVNLSLRNRHSLALVGAGLLAALLLLCLITAAGVAVIRKALQISFRDLKRLAVMVESPSEAMFILAPDGTILNWNAGAEKIFGYTAAEAVGQDAALLLPDDQGADHDVAMERLRQGQHVLGVETQRLTRDGRRIWIAMSASPIVDDGSEINSISVVAHDITAQKRAEAELRASNERYRMVSQATSDVIWDWDMATGTILWADNVQASFGYLLGEIENTVSWWSDRIHVDDWSAVMSSLGGAVRGTQAHWSYEYRFRRADGGYASVLNRGSILRDSTGVAVRMIGSITDISERKRLERRSRFLARAVARISSSLDYPTTLERLAGAAVPELADWCCVEMLEGEPSDDRGLRVKRVFIVRRRGSGAGGGGEDDADDIPLVVREEAEEAISGVFASGQPIFVPDLDRSAPPGLPGDVQNLEVPRTYGVRSLMSVPLQVRNRVVGALTLGLTDARRTYTPPDVALATELAQHAATAVDNARLYAAEQHARAFAERMQLLTAALAVAGSRRQVGDIVLRHGMEATGAETGLLAVAADSGVSLEVMSSRGFHHGAGEGRAWSLDETTPLAEAVRSGRPVLIGSHEAWRREHPDAPFPHPGWNQAWAALPLVLADRRAPLGAILWTYSEPRTFSDDDAVLLQTLAGQAAQALERARLHEAERQARSEAESANRAKSEFLSCMSHELRTPLTSVIGFASVMESNPTGRLGAEEMEFVGRILRNGRYLLGLINQTLDLSKIENGKLEPELGPASLNDLVLNVVEQFRATAGDAPVRLTMVRPEAECVAVTDADRLRQILTNLVDNALKFTDRGEVKVVLSIDGTVPRIDVVDTGIGISPSAIARIFQPFVQIEQGAARRFGGSGLGLAISHSLAQLLGYRLEVWSEVGAGSTFTLYLEGCQPSVVLRHPAHREDASRLAMSRPPALGAG